MKKIIFLITAVSMLAAGCATMNKQQKGTLPVRQVVH